MTGALDNAHLDVDLGASTLLRAVSLYAPANNFDLALFEVLAGADASSLTVCYSAVADHTGGPFTASCNRDASLLRVRLPGPFRTFEILEAEIYVFALSPPPTSPPLPPPPSPPPPSPPPPINRMYVSGDALSGADCSSSGSACSLSTSLEIAQGSAGLPAVITLADGVYKLSAPAFFNKTFSASELWLESSGGEVLLDAGGLSEQASIVQVSGTVQTASLTALWAMRHSPTAFIVLLDVGGRCGDQLGRPHNCEFSEQLGNIGDRWFADA